MACSSCSIIAHPPNVAAVDFYCEACSAAYQLKAMRSWNERRIPDGGYNAMMRALQSDSIPNLLVMHYNCDWYVRNLILIPSFFFSTAAIQKRKPLNPNARRAGWIGCNILLSEIASDGKIPIVSQGSCLPPEVVRVRYDKLRPLAALKVDLRGWALDVLRAIKLINRENFTLQEVYNFEKYLADIYSENRNIRPKIRQQLQVLRDLGIIEFKARGQYRLLELTHGHDVS